MYEPVKIPDITAIQRQAPREQIKPVVRIQKKGSYFYLVINKTRV